MRKSNKLAIPEAVDRHLRTSSDLHGTDLATFLERGADLMNLQALTALATLLPEVQNKLRTATPSERLQRRVDALVRFFEETPGVAGFDRARRDVAFALLYFLKGFDRIPDTLPEIGLMDDALVVEIVIDRHRSLFRRHWDLHGRTWPEEL